VPGEELQELPVLRVTGVIERAADGGALVGPPFRAVA
jgi:hypothetical protein